MDSESRVRLAEMIAGAAPGDTIVLVVMNDKEAAQWTYLPTSGRLLSAATSLLDQAADLAESEGDEVLVENIHEALDILPDRFDEKES
jgi:flagellar biosynthesis/type III secretory pathway M-ring protein FliF/YscJ